MGAIGEMFSDESRRAGTHGGKPKAKRSKISENSYFMTTKRKEERSPLQGKESAFKVEGLEETQLRYTR